VEGAPTLNGKHFIALHGLAVDWRRVDGALRFSELVRMLESLKAAGIKSGVNDD
jgi:hypothetical protein